MEWLLRYTDPGEAQQAIEKAMLALDYCIDLGLTGEED